MKTKLIISFSFIFFFSLMVGYAQRPTLWLFDCSTEPDTIYYSWTASPLVKRVTFADGVMTINSTNAIYPRIPFDQAYDITGYPTAKIKLKTSVADKRLKIEIRKFGQNTTGSPIGGAFYVPLTGDGEWHELTVNLTGDNYVGNIGLSFRNAADDGFASGIFEIDYISVGGASYSISASASANGSIVSGAGTYDAGASVSLTAAPESGYRFLNWTENGIPVSTENPYTFTVSNARTLVANFASNVVNINTDTNASTLINCSTCDVTLADNGVLNIDESKIFNTITISPGSKVTNSSSLITSTMIINSDANGTGTYVDNGTSTITTAIVQQYLGSTRNWYITPPVSGATVPIGQTYYSYDEGGGNTEFSAPATAYWVAISAGSILNPGKGYIAQPGIATTLNFTGVLNTGEKTVPLTRTAGKTKEGFNLVANPYPSYLDWSMVDTSASKIMSTVWYRTQTLANTYTFDTYNGELDAATSNGVNLVTKLIPPMQAFWVRVKAGETGGTLTFTNAMRKHADNTSNKFKVQASSKTQLLRLRISNGQNSDEALVCFNPKAQNSFDNYDSQKMFNNSVSVPEIYTVAGNEKLAINGMSGIMYDAEIPVGFTTLQSGDFSLCAAEISDFATGIRIILKDKLLNTEIELSESIVYNFSSQVVTSGSDRFSLKFRVPDTPTETDNNTEKQNTQVFVNAQNLITIISTEKCNYAIYNTLGYKISEGVTTANRTIVNNLFKSGMYIVKVSENNKELTSRVVIK